MKRQAHESNQASAKGSTLTSSVVTVPGKAGVATALVAEVVIAGGMMLMVLFMTNTPRLARFTGLFGGALVFLYITFEAPLSVMEHQPRPHDRVRVAQRHLDGRLDLFRRAHRRHIARGGDLPGAAQRRASRLREMES